MKAIRMALCAIVAIAFSSCEKDKPIPDYEPGRGRISGTIDSGQSFNVEGPLATFILKKPNLIAGDNKDDLIIHANIDLAIGSAIGIMCGDFPSKTGSYYLYPGPTMDDDNANFTTQIAPQDAYYLYIIAGRQSVINITRMAGTYIEGNYYIRLQHLGSNQGPYMTIEGSFQGNLRVDG